MTPEQITILAQRLEILAVKEFGAKSEKEYFNGRIIARLHDMFRAELVRANNEIEELETGDE